jgi:DNA-binding NarL/FixJ family response regulator
MKMTNLVLVDDHRLFVESLSSIIETRTDDMKVVGVAYDGSRALDLIKETQPDIVLMDVRMPGIDGVEAVLRIRDIDPKIKIIMLTIYDDDEYVQQAISNGALGYLLKDVPPEELFNAVRAIRDGAFLVSSQVKDKLFSQPSEDVYHGMRSEVELPEWYFQLTRKERHMLRLVVEGCNNQEISDQVNLAVQTVKNYLSRIYDTIETHSRTEAIKVARQYVEYL